MKKKIFWKFFLAFFVLCLGLALAFYSLSLKQARSFHLQLSLEQLQRLGNLISAEMSSSWTELEPEQIERIVREKGRLSQVRLTLVDPRGRVMADSNQDAGLMENHLDRPEIAAALLGAQQWNFNYSFTLQERMLYLALPLEVEGKTVAALRLSLFVRDIDESFFPWHWNQQIALLALLFLSVLFSLLLSRNLIRPISNLARAARNLKDGNWQSQLDLRRKDELGQLAQDFNEMAEAQRDTMKKLNRSQAELEAILYSISDGLLVIDSQENILRAGPRFRQLIGEADPTGKPYWQYLRSRELADLVRQAAEKSIFGEFDFQGRSYLARVSPLPPPGGWVITLHDLSESRQLETQKKDFVANVSHELRTPLTAIKGYAETLAEEARGDEKKHLEVILRHTDRLIDLTRDLLTLAELESREVKLQREIIKWPDLLAELRVLFEKKLREKKLTIEVSIAPEVEMAEFKGDRFRLEQMLINLLDNSVKYTDQGGVAISLGLEAGRLLIECRDNGRGIAAEHLPRIFERFYLVDKARSRQNGGTGLGLAIVKHIVHLHGGEIRVQSTEGRGSVFSISLPFQTSS